MQYFCIFFQGWDAAHDKAQRNANRIIGATFPLAKITSASMSRDSLLRKEHFIMKGKNTKGAVYPIYRAKRKDNVICYVFREVIKSCR